ncbi:MAG: hypothetical protein AUI09_04025 [Gemmatimonadetes bacterium 13_2_20CM_2_66_5]|nr:MAG: hypothetical protein AUI09_04025 [Gemmatimonadetes bacterium 13_2_20CM_2_66_5]
MILSLLAVAVFVQGAEVTASVDRTQIRVGEELTLTVRARTRSADAVEIVLPSLNGFAIVGSRDMTEVAINGASGSTRTTVRELQLRAQQAGALLIGPVRARQGVSVVATDPILVTVDSAADRTALTLSPLARSLLESTPAPVSRRADRVALTMLVPSDTVYNGQQVDLIAAAWIPRELNQRMRRPPLLTLVTPEGVWAYPAATSSGVALSRQVGGPTRSRSPSCRCPRRIPLRTSSAKACVSICKSIPRRRAWESPSTRRSQSRASATWRCGPSLRCVGQRDFACTPRKSRSA